MAPAIRETPKLKVLVVEGLERIISGAAAVRRMLPPVARSGFDVAAEGIVQ